MKYKLSRKLNLANIDKDLWPFETEDIGIEDADSFDEAQKKIDQYYNERIGYYRALSDAHKQQKVAINTPDFGTSRTANLPISNTSPEPGFSNTPGFSAEPPKEFQ